MTIFVSLLAMLLVVWVVTTTGEERWWGIGMFALMGGILLAVKWIGADREE